MKRKLSMIGAIFWFMTASSLLFADESAKVEATQHLNNVPGPVFVRSNITGLTVNGDFAFLGWGCKLADKNRAGLLAIDKAAIEIVDISAPAQPKRVWTEGSNRIPTALNVNNNKLYVTWDTEHTGTDILEIFDIEQPEQPRRIGGCARSTFPSCLGIESPDQIAVEGTCAFIAVRNQIFVVDVSDARNPAMVGQWKTSGWIHALKTRGKTLYVGASGLKIVDITSPPDLLLLGGCRLPGEAWGISLVDNKAYVANERLRSLYGKVSIIDIADPSSPRLLGDFDTGRGAWNLASSADTVYVSGRPDMEVFDVSQTNKPRRLTHWSPRSAPSQIAIDGNRLYVSDEIGFQILDCREPESLHLLGEYSPIDLKVPSATDLFPEALVMPKK